MDTLYLDTNCWDTHFWDTLFWDSLFWYTLFWDTLFLDRKYFGHTFFGTDFSQTEKYLDRKKYHTLFWGWLFWTEIVWTEGWYSQAIQPPSECYSNSFHIILSKLRITSFCDLKRWSVMSFLSMDESRAFSEAFSWQWRPLLKAYARLLIHGLSLVLQTMSDVYHPPSRIQSGSHCSSMDDYNRRHKESIGKIIFHYAHFYVEVKSRSKSEKVKFW